jgi:hypothetical protein
MWRAFPRRGKLFPAPLLNTVLKKSNANCNTLKRNARKPRVNGRLEKRQSMRYKPPWAAVCEVTNDVGEINWGSCNVLTQFITRSACSVNCFINVTFVDKFGHAGHFGVPKKCASDTGTFLLKRDSPGEEMRRMWGLVTIPVRYGPLDSGKPLHSAAA